MADCAYNCGVPFDIALDRGLPVDDVPTALRSSADRQSRFGG